MCVSLSMKKTLYVVGYISRKSALCFLDNSPAFSPAFPPTHTFNKMQSRCQIASPHFLPPAHPRPLPSLFLLLHHPSLSVSCCIPSSKRRAPRHHLIPSHLPCFSSFFFLIFPLSVLHLTKIQHHDG